MLQYERGRAERLGDLLLAAFQIRKGRFEAADVPPKVLDPREVLFVCLDVEVLGSAEGFVVTSAQ
ncbi:hypothetical protein [Tsukamurella sp. TY48]|uniref:hypothetical protein n=1 Tax=Tsukamurella TaxID=2060 RepID=UPI0021023DDD|nr:hypothetical protein [Tsukamurella sp. TY48]